MMSLGLFILLNHFAIQHFENNDKVLLNLLVTFLIAYCM